MDDMEWGPWIDHDGKGMPAALVNSMIRKGWTHLNRHSRGGVRKETPTEQANPDYLDTAHPGWTWKRSGWFGRGYWVASDPEYARIISYRFGRVKPKSQEKSEQVELLRAIAKGDLEPQSEPSKEVEASDG